jgi:hypothetical protein
MPGRRNQKRHRREWVQQLEHRRLLANLGELGIYLVDHSTGQRVEHPSAGQHVEIHASFVAEGLAPGTIVRVQRETANGVLYSELAAPPAWAGREVVTRNLFTWAVPPTNAWVKVSVVPRGTVEESSEDDNAQTLALTPKVNPTNLDVPAYHSLAGARIGLYLDFDGHYQEQFAGSCDVTTPAYDSDGNALALSPAEREEIRQIWARVAEDYAPFDIDVTTEAPAEGRYEGYQRVAIGGASCDWYQFSAAGTALAGSFYEMADDPSAAFVFVEQANGDGSAFRFPIATVADGASHEAGHAFGLWHQAQYDDGGQLVSEYHPGTGGWGPIMGRGGNPVSTWTLGPTHESATAVQDDMAVLTDGRNGFGYRADDAPDDAAAAKMVGTFAGGGSVLESAGVIERMNDVDAYSATLPAGRYRFAANVAIDGPNLDAVLEVRDARGGLVATSDPPDRPSASVEITVPAGTYYILVRGTGVYGRVGQYGIAIGEPAPQAQPGPVPAPPTASGPAADLAARLIAQPPKTVTAGTPASASVAVSNVGDVASKGPVTVKVFASRDRSLATGGTLLGKAVIRASVGSGTRKDLNVRISYPKSLAAGSYFVIATVEGKGAEKSADNNVAASAAKVRVISRAAKLTATVVPPRPGLAHQTWAAKVAIRNQGDATFSGKAIVKLFASADGLFGNGDDVLIGRTTASATLAVGKSKTVTLQARPADRAGTFQIFAVVTQHNGETIAARKAVKVRFA